MQGITCWNTDSRVGIFENGPLGEDIRGNYDHNLKEICTVGMSEWGSGTPNLIAMSIDLKSLCGIHDYMFGGVPPIWHLI